MEPIIHIIDDDESYRIAIGRLVEASGYRVAVYGSADEMLSRLPDHQAGCILLDLQMPGIDGLELQHRLTEKAPQLPVVFLTGHGDIDSGVQAMKSGAVDFLQKSAPSENILQVIRHALEHNERRRETHGREAALRMLVDRLTKRERQVFEQMVRGRRNKQIAYVISTTERTVKAHRRSIMDKLEVRSLAEAVAIAERLALLDDKEQAKRS